MKYMQTGGFQNHPLMRRTLAFAFLFVAGLWITNFAMYFTRMSLDPSSVVNYYRGSEENFQPARSTASMLEVTHGHLGMMGIVILLMTHLVIFAPFDDRTKSALITATFLSALLDEGSGWLVRFVHPGFAILKPVSFILFQGLLAFLLWTLVMFLKHAGGQDGHRAAPGRRSKHDLV